MKLGAAYCFFDGEELLEYSVKSIRRSVDYIVVVAQEVSYTGNFWTLEAKEVCHNLLEKGLIDDLVLFTSKPGWSSHQQETRKRNIGLQMCKQAKCTHILPIDADEFYRTLELDQLKEEVSKSNMSISCCYIYSYHKTPRYRCISPHPTQIACLQKILPSSEFVLGESHKYASIAQLDPTRVTTVGGPIKLFPIDFIVCHHMYGVRKDNLRSKFTNTSAFSRYTPQRIEEIAHSYEQLDPTINNETYIVVDNIFNIEV